MIKKTSLFVVGMISVCVTASVFANETTAAKLPPIISLLFDDPKIPKDELADINKDGVLNILLLGSSKSIQRYSSFSNTGAHPFSTQSTAEELQNILLADPEISVGVYVESEDIYTSKQVATGVGQGGSANNLTYHRHSLMQYYYWPEGLDNRNQNLSGNNAKDWDYVVIAADPYIVATTPGYYSLGVDKIASKVAEGNAKPLLLMMWPKQPIEGVSIDHFEEFTYRASDGAKVEISTVPAGLAWKNLSAQQQATGSTHPTANGAYVAAASIYSHIFDQSAATSDYEYNNAIAYIALSTIKQEANKQHYSGTSNFISPFMACNIDDMQLNYTHTGSSSENGIKAGLNWVFSKSDATLVRNGTPPVNFNYGRANSNFEANKRYKIDASKSNFSFGFPMQDNSIGGIGDISMQYGLDKRSSFTENDTDLGTASFMIKNAELPLARAVPIRTLLVQMKEVIPGHPAYSDSWHMHRNLDKAVGGYMYTILTGDCALGTQPSDQTSAAWKTWMSHKIGYETAWKVMTMKTAPECGT
jgi:hypothetical protein